MEERYIRYECARGLFVVKIEADCWLFNPGWKVMPSISYFDRPCVMTCQEHNGGTKSYMIHSCRQKHNLVAKCLDKIGKAVINPRIIKPIQAAKYTTSFEMYYQSGSFNRINTCTNSSHGNKSY